VARLTNRQKQIQDLRDRQNNDWFFKDWEGTEFVDDFDKTFKTMTRAVIGVWIFWALFSVGLVITSVLLLLHFFG